MQMSDADLVAFRSRCLQASLNGFSVAKADEYLAALTTEAGSVASPDGTEGSAAHLFELSTAALAVRGGEKKGPSTKKSEKAKAPEPVLAKVEAPKPEPVKVEPEPVMVEPEPVKVEAAPVVEPEPVKEAPKAKEEPKGKTTEKKGKGK